ncbi:MAG: hypothetical protein ABI630_03070 [Betaproteobacteria bacterium]
MLNFLLKMKVSQMASSAKSLVSGTGCKCKVESFGAYDVDPRLLVFAVQVPTDAERDKLRSREALVQALKLLPAKSGWPEAARNDVVFDIESQETVDRENEGNWSFRYG